MIVVQDSPQVVIDQLQKHVDGELGDELGVVDGVLCIGFHEDTGVEGESDMNEYGMFNLMLSTLGAVLSYLASGVNNDDQTVAELLDQMGWTTNRARLAMVVLSKIGSPEVRRAADLQLGASPLMDLLKSMVERPGLYNKDDDR